jgi:hypothetical protein
MPLLTTVNEKVFMSTSNHRKLCWEIDHVAAYTRRADENRLIGNLLALCEIAFAKGFNSTTNLPLPHWKHYKSQHLNRCRSEQEAFEAGINFAQEWERLE